MASLGASGHMRSGPSRWERAYSSFQTADEEIEKFLRRYRSLGIDRWDKGLSVLEVCAGRGSILKAWHQLGFPDVVGVDFSEALAGGYRGPGHMVLGDARALPFATASRDVVVVQGGLHHLATFEDVGAALAEMARVAKADGRIVIIEPWRTPFLRMVNWLVAQPIVRRWSVKLDALATMNEEEYPLYDRWLDSPETVLALVRGALIPSTLRRRWGKILLIGRPRPAASPTTREREAEGRA
jgi:SAM-dependent methyltransferase